MKHTGVMFIGMSLLAMGLQARPVGKPVEFQRPTTSTTVIHPMTTVPTFHPSTTNPTVQPTTQTSVVHPQTNVAVVQPITQTQVVHPQTTVGVLHPQTTVSVFHPQTTVEVVHPQTVETAAGDVGADGKTGGKPTSFSARTVPTSMSDFKPMQAKDLSAKTPMDKAASLGGGDMNLGNSTNETEKDNANKSSLLGAQAGASQSLDVDPNKKSINLEGLEKLLTDRAKFQEKKQ